MRGLFMGGAGVPARPPEGGHGGPPHPHDRSAAMGGDAHLESIRLAGIVKTYARGRVTAPVLKGVSLAVGGGEMGAVMGARGSGKTTLINLLAALGRPPAGRYWLDGEEVSPLPAEDRALLRSRKV